MGHPKIRLELEMRWEPELGRYGPDVAGHAEGSPSRRRMSFDECVDALMFLADFLSGENLLDLEDHPDDMDKVTSGSEQLLLDAIYQVHGRWYPPETPGGGCEN